MKRLRTSQRRLKWLRRPRTSQRRLKWLRRLRTSQRKKNLLKLKKRKRLLHLANAASIQQTIHVAIASLGPHHLGAMKALKIVPHVVPGVATRQRRPRKS